MNMKEFSSLVGLSSHTLRYYEKIGLLKNIQRNRSGHRVYTSKDLGWIEFVKRLKETAMPLEEILEYALLRESGVDTVLQRQVLLEQHRENLLAHIEQQQSHLIALEEKIKLLSIKFEERHFLQMRMNILRWCSIPKSFAWAHI